MPSHKCIPYKTIVLGQISPCLLFTLHLWLICLCDGSEDCWQRHFSSDWWLWEIWECNPPKLYWYVHTAILLYCPDQRCHIAKNFFLRAILWLSSSLSRIRKVGDIMTPYLSAVMACCWLARDGLGRFPLLLKPRVYYRELSPAGFGISRYIGAACCISG